MASGVLSCSDVDSAAGDSSYRLMSSRRRLRRAIEASTALKFVMVAAQGVVVTAPSAFTTDKLCVGEGSNGTLDSYARALSALNHGRLGRR